MAKFATLLALFFSILFVSCAPAAHEDAGTAAAEPDAYIIRLEAAGERGFVATLPDGTAYTDADAYAADFAAIAADAAAQGLSIAFAVAEPAQAANAGDADPQGDLGILRQPLSTSGSLPLPLNYLVSFSASDGQFVGGCVHAAAYPGASLRLSHDGLVLWDLQLGRYRQGNATCLGLYEYHTGYTKCGCAPAFPDVLYEIRDALVSKGVGAITALLIARAVTPVVTTAVAL